MLSGKPVTLQTLAAQLSEGKLSSSDLIECSLAGISDKQGQGSVAFTKVFAQRARQEAQASDKRRAAGQTLSVLDGLPISVKDLFDIAGYRTLAGSVVLSDAPAAAEDALVVQRLRQVGAVIVGTTNMTEFAYSGLGLNPHYGTPLSPWDRQTSRIAGGSSSGAAVSVVEGMVAGAIGTDTGGSVRIPAAFCGLVGYKPTASRIDMRGTLPLSTKLDCIGPIANSVADCIWLAAAMAGESIKAIEPQPLSGLKLGVPNQLVLEGMDDTVSEGFNAACVLLEQAGAVVVRFDLPELFEIAQMNAAGGFTAAQAWAWHKDLLNSRQAKYDPRVAVRIRRGVSLDKGYIELLDCQRRDWIKRVAQKINGFDAMVMPTVPIVPPALEPLKSDNELYAKTNVLVLRNPTVINFLDGCAVSLPCHNSGQAPVGLMLAALAGEDLRLLGISLACERALKTQS